MKIFNYGKSKTLLYVTCLIVLFIGIFTYGVGVGRYEWPPFSLFQDIKEENLFEENVKYDGNEKELLQSAFTEPIISSELLYHPVNSINEIYELNRNNYINVCDFYEASDKINLLNTEDIFLDKGKTQILKLEYDFSEKVYEAYSYTIVLDSLNETKNKKAVLIIPGSGKNQSSDIYKNKPSNYHYGLIDLLKRKGYDIYIYIKPNEDVLAFHNGTRKVDDRFYVNWHLNHGSSYSAQYIISSMVFSKYLKENYSETIVAGLSQGGAAALWNSIQTEPDGAIVASGYSILGEKLQLSGHNQIIIPGLWQNFNPDTVRSIIGRNSTELLFTYGTEETGIYKMEAITNRTCDFIRDISNIDCVIHTRGHVFPVKEIDRFLNLMKNN